MKMLRKKAFVFNMFATVIVSFAGLCPSICAANNQPQVKAEQHACCPQEENKTPSSQNTDCCKDHAKIFFSEKQTHEFKDLLLAHYLFVGFVAEKLSLVSITHLLPSSYAAPPHSLGKQQLFTLKQSFLI